MKNIFTKQFRHFFLILFAVLLILQLLGSGTFIITKTKQLLFTVFITSCLTSIFSYSRIYFYNYLLALLPLLSLLFCKTAAGEVITSVNIAYYSIFSLSFTNIIFFLYYYSTAYKTLRLLSPVVLLLQICTFLLSTAVWHYYKPMFLKVTNICKQTLLGRLYYYFFFLFLFIWCFLCFYTCVLKAAA